MKSLQQLERLPEIFDRLRLGGHICPEDGAIYYQLRSDFESYRAAFETLGFELAAHERGFYYFVASGELGKEASQMAVFFFVLVDALGNEGQNVREAVFEGEHTIDDLPHFRLESHRQCLSEVDIHDRDDLETIVKRLARYGFAELRTADRFRFRPPAWRFVDLCYEAADAQEEGA